jgi:hypothetical protein
MLVHSTCCAAMALKEQRLVAAPWKQQMCSRHNLTAQVSNCRAASASRCD